MSRPMALAGDEGKVTYFEGTPIPTSLVLVIVLAYLLLGERPSLREWSGIGLVLAGVIVLATKK